MTEIVDGIPQPVVLTQEDIDVIGEIYVKATYFEVVGSGTTSGTVPKPAGGGADVSFVMDEWGTATDALVTTMDGGKPTYQSPVDGGGTPITTTFDTAGNFVFSATPVPAASHAVVFVYKCFLKNFDADESIFETEIGAGGDHGLLTGLGDDDHLQYHTDGRADTWFTGKDLNDLGTKNHADLDLLGADDHSQYALLAGRNGGQTLIGGTLTTQNLVLQDNAVDANFLTLTQAGLMPGVDATLDLGEGSTPLNWRTLFLDNDGGNVIVCPSVVSGGGPTDYTFQCGGGHIPGQQNQGGTFKFQMSAIGATTGTSNNYFVIDLGTPDYFAAGTENQFIIQSFNGVATYGFVSAFSGWVGGEYGFALERISGLETRARGMFFDNRVPYSDANRAIDFRIDGTNILTIENDQAVAFPIGIIDAPVGLTINGYGTLTAATIFGVYDSLTMTAAETNAGMFFGLRPNGTSPTTLQFQTNSSNSTNYAVFEQSISGAVAKMVTWRAGTGTGAAQFIIGEAPSALFGLGFLDSLTTIDFYFAGAVEAQIQPDTMIFNNGAIDTQIDWSVNGQLGLQVATNDILRLTATQVQIPSDTIGLFFGTGIDASITYDGTDLQVDSSLQNPSDITVDCGTDKTIELIETVWDDIMVPGFTVEATGANKPTLGAFLGAGSLQIYRFTGTGVQLKEVFFTVQFPHTYKEGTDVIPHVHWVPTDANAGNVVWQLEYSWANINATFPAVTTIATPADAASGTAWDHQVAPFASISGTGKTISSMMNCRLFRDPAHGSDTYGFDAGFLQFDIHHEINTMGSRQEFVK